MTASREHDYKPAPDAVWPDYKCICGGNRDSVWHSNLDRKAPR